MVVEPEGLFVDQELSQRPGLVPHPGVQGGDELVAADEVHLKGQDAEQQVAVSRTGRDGHGQDPRRRGSSLSLSARGADEKRLQAEKAGKRQATRSPTGILDREGAVSVVEAGANQSPSCLVLLA